MINISRESEINLINILIDQDIISGKDLVEIKKISGEGEKSQLDAVFELNLTDEEKIRYGQLNAQSAISIEDYLAQFGASTISRKRIKTYMLEPFKAKYGATDKQINRFI